MFEIEAEIKDFPGYTVSTWGRVRSLNYRRTGKTKTLIPRNNNGYLQVELCKDGKTKNLWIHRLVASAFIPNPRNYPCINHKDEDKTNNAVSNLEWCTYRYNTRYGSGLKRMAAKLKNGPRAKQVLQYDTQGNLVKTWPSIHEIERSLGFSQSSICQCCNGKRGSANGYIWKYA